MKKTPNTRLTKLYHDTKFQPRSTSELGEKRPQSLHKIAQKAPQIAQKCSHKKNQTDSESTQDAEFRNIYCCICHKNFCAITHQYHDVAARILLQLCKTYHGATMVTYLPRTKRIPSDAATQTKNSSIQTSLSTHLNITM